MRWSWILSGLGFAAMLAGVLRLSSATVGGRVDDFSQRRTYSQVKRAAHEAYLPSLAIALAGLGLAIAGSRMRSRPD